MRWRKLGRIFCPGRHADWMVSHASNPTVEPGEGVGVRVYFSCRDAQNRSSVAFFDFNLEDPAGTLRVCSAPVLGPGERGLYDDSGASVGSVVEQAGNLYLYYVGWNLGVTVPWRNSIGLAVRRPGRDDFERFLNVPIVDRSTGDPFSLSYPWVLKDGGLWRMWYGSNLTWGATPTDMLHVIKYAESVDGIVWRRPDHVAIPLQHPGEYAVSRPCVLRGAVGYRMWYAYRAPAYRIGYAESLDGVIWERKDEQVGIDVSPTGWDSEMMAYPCVFERMGRLFMLYNGNGYGKTGVGLAVLDQDL